MRPLESVADSITEPQRVFRELAERRGFGIGTCVNAPPLLADARYRQTLAREFNILTPENALKFGVISPRRGAYDYSDADAIVDFAGAHDMHVRGHVLVWYAQLPHWLTTGKFTRAELTRILTDHIAAVVGRYAGRIAVWDVVNEAIAEDGSFRDNVWHRTMGPEYVDIAFRAAREADPAARLFYNDYGIEGSDAHTRAVHALLRDLRARGTPIDGAGMQMHLDLERLPDMQRLPASIDRLASLGLRIHVTECDVRMSLDHAASADQLATQARVYRDIVRCCLDHASCDALILWGFTDRYSWIPQFFPGQGAALVLDEDYRPKSSYRAIADELAR